MKAIFLKLLPLFLAAVLLAGNSRDAFRGLRTEEDNFRVSTDPKYERLITRVWKASHSNSYQGSVLIATDDEAVLYGGPRSLTTEGKPADPYTTYDIASCSKTFTAVAVFQQIEAGRLSIDDTLDRFFPEYEAGKGITIYHLLHMQSGIPDYLNEPEGFWVKADGQGTETLLRRLCRDEITDGEFLDNLYAAPLLFTPGAEQSYSNTNYHLLAIIVEQVSGMRFCDYLQRNIFDPCGMEHTTSMIAGNETSVPGSFDEVLRIGMVNEAGYFMAPNQERGDGGIHTCMADLWAFDRALFGGRLVGAASLGEMMNFDMDYGCGLFSYGQNAWGHSGGNGAYQTQNIVIETEQFGRVYFIASTSTDAGSYGLQAVMKAVMGELGVR